MSPHRKALLRAACERNGIELTSREDAPPPVRGFKPTVVFIDEVPVKRRRGRPPSPTGPKPAPRKKYVAKVWKARNSRGRATKYDYDAIAARVQAGETFTAIAKSMGIDASTIRYAAMSRGIKSTYVRKAPKPRPSRCYPIVWELMEKGMTRRKDLLAATGFGSSTITTAKRLWKERGKVV